MSGLQTLVKVVKIVTLALLIWSVGLIWPAMNLTALLYWSLGLLLAVGLMSRLKPVNQLRPVVVPSLASTITQPMTDTGPLGGC